MQRKKDEAELRDYFSLILILSVKKAISDLQLE